MFLAYALASLLAIAAAWRLDFSFVNDDAQSQLAKLRESAPEAQQVDAAQDVEKQKVAPSRDGAALKRHHSVHAADVWEREPGADALLQASTVPVDASGMSNDLIADAQSSSSAAHSQIGLPDDAGRIPGVSQDDNSLNEPLLAGSSGREVETGAAETATFRQRYLMLLHDPRMLVFLAKALVMGVRSCKRLLLTSFCACMSACGVQYRNIAIVHFRLL